jgi:hypothetical protein
MKARNDNDSDDGASSNKFRPDLGADSMMPALIRITTCMHTADIKINSAHWNKQLQGYSAMRFLRDAIITNQTKQKSYP